MEPQRKKRKTVRSVVDIRHLYKKCFENDLITENIFGHLDGNDKAVAARVCKQWHDIIYKPRMWRDDDLCIDMDAVNMRIMAPSLKKRNITRLRLESCADSVTERRHVVHQFFCLMRSLGHIIQSLDISDLSVGLSVPTLVQALNYRTMSLLETFILNAESDYSKVLLKTICERCPQLKSLELPFHRGFRDSSLLIIQQYLPELRELMLPTTSITNAGVSYLTQLPLRKLFLCFCNNINEDCILLLSQLRNSLECLDIANCINLDPNRALYHIVNSGLCLTELCIGISGRSGGVVPDAVNHFALEFFLLKEAGRRLKTFYLEDLKFSALTGASIVENCPELNDLRMEGDDVTDRAKEAFERLKATPYQPQPHSETRQRSYSL